MVFKLVGPTTSEKKFRSKQYEPCVSEWKFSDGSRIRLEVNKYTRTHEVAFFGNQSAFHPNFTVGDPSKSGGAAFTNAVNDPDFVGISADIMRAMNPVDLSTLLYWLSRDLTTGTRHPIVGSRTIYPAMPAQSICTPPLMEPKRSTTVDVRIASDDLEKFHVYTAEILY